MLLSKCGDSDNSHSILLRLWVIANNATSDNPHSILLRLWVIANTATKEVW